MREQYGLDATYGASPLPGIYKRLTQYQHKTAQGSNHEMGTQQEHPAGRDGIYNKNAAETSGRKLTIYLSNPKTTSKPSEDQSIYQGASYAAF
jgi:hypothetical protein